MYTKPSLQRFGTFRELTKNTQPNGVSDGAFHQIEMSHMSNR